MFSDLYIDSVYLRDEIDKNSYLNDILAIKYLKTNGIKFSKRVTFFIGENGTGKSTLIEAIAVAYGFNPEGGTKNFNFSTKTSHSDLYKKIVLSRPNRANDGFFLRAESFYNIATYLEKDDLMKSYGNTSLHNMSHGESFMMLINKRFGGNGLYILDEPEAALSPKRLLSLMLEIDSLVKNNSQFIIATHSPILITFPNAEIFEISDKGILSKPYQETEHYRITKNFLSNPEKSLHYLLEDE